MRRHGSACLGGKEIYHNKAAGDEQARCHTETHLNNRCRPLNTNRLHNSRKSGAFGNPRLYDLFNKGSCLRAHLDCLNVSMDLWSLEASLTTGILDTKLVIVLN